MYSSVHKVTPKSNKLREIRLFLMRTVPYESDLDKQNREDAANKGGLSPRAEGLPFPFPALEQLQNAILVNGAPGYVNFVHSTEAKQNGTNRTSTEQKVER